MANNYLQYSALLPLESPEELEWSKALIDRMTCFAEEGVPTLDSEDDESPENPAEEYALEHGFKEQNGWMGCVEVSENPSEVWFYSEEGGDLEMVAAFIQEFFLKWRPKGVFAVTWAETCSRPRVGEFGGGAMIVTATGKQFMNTWDWVQQQVKEIK